MECRTCAMLQTIKQFRRQLNKDFKQRGIPPISRNKFAAAIVDRSGHGRTTYYKAGGRRIPLNYCPECGRQIKTKRST